MRGALFLSLAALALVSGTATAAPPGCVSASDLLTPATFAKYPAKPMRGPWHAPDVRTGTAHLFRTLVRHEGHGPPDFAGQYKVVALGCGAGVLCPLFVDLKTGRSMVFPKLRIIGWDFDLGEVPGTPDSRLTYRPDSSLLVAIGTPDENPRMAGAYLYDWHEGRPRLVRFVAREALCHERGGA